MATITSKDKISIPKAEYLRLKKLDERFGDLFSYIENLMDIREAREQIRLKKIIPQDKLFNELGF